jgi:hypothetical protein
VTTAPRIELLHVPGCPQLERVRATLADCLADEGIEASVEEHEGAYPSPTLLVDGRDVVTGMRVEQRECCRLDLPTREQILAALGFRYA